MDTARRTKPRQNGAGIQAARQCDGFIGHIGSAASYSFFHAMCFQYRNTYWRCPPWFMFD